MDNDKPKHMPREDAVSSQMEDVIRIGKENARILDAVRNWCSHLDLKASTAGTVAELYNQPNHIRISCKHATGGAAGAVLDHLASGFIVDNCLNCAFHQPLAQENFGVQVKIKHEQALAEAKKLQEEENKEEASVKEDINKLIALQEKDFSAPVSSILKLIKELETTDNPQVVSLALLEGSKLQPAFFSPETLNAMSIYFKNETWGGNLVAAAENVLSHHPVVPKYLKDKVLKLLPTNLHIEAVTGICGYIVDFTKLHDYEGMIREVIHSLNYLLVLGYQDNSGQEKTKREAFISRCVQAGQPFMTRLFKEYLGNESKLIRINICRLIDNLLESNVSLGTDLFAPLISAYDLPDDPNLESADRAAAVTLAGIIKLSDHTALQTFIERVDKLNRDAYLSALHVYDLLAEDTAFMRKNEEFSGQLSDSTMKAVLDKNLEDEIRERAFNLLKVMHTSGVLPENSFDTLLGCLSALIEEKKLFQWYEKELHNEEGKVSTFNPLRGMPFIDIHLAEMRIGKYITEIKDLLQDDITQKPESSYPQLLQVLVELHCATQGLYKKELISVLTAALRAPRYIAQFIPHLYTCLFDTTEPEVRYAALDFLDALIRNFPPLVTDTLLTIIDAFSEDADVGVRGKICDLIGSIACSERLRITEGHITYIQKGFLDKKLYVLRKSVKAVKHIHHSLSVTQFRYVFQILVDLEKTYIEEKHKEFRDEITDTLFIIIDRYPKLYQFFIDNYAIPGSRSSDTRAAGKYLAKLKTIKDKHPQYTKAWYLELLHYLGKTHRDPFSSYDKRSGLINQLFSVPYDIFAGNILDFSKTAAEISKRDPIDSVSFLFVLGHFEMYEQIGELTSKIEQQIPPVMANLALLKIVGVIKSCSSVMIDPFDPATTIPTIQKISHEL
jgi:hypothetical protein